MKQAQPCCTFTCTSSKTAAASPAWRCWRKATSPSTPGRRRASRPSTCSCAVTRNPARRWTCSSAPSNPAASWSASTSAAWSKKRHTQEYRKGRDQWSRPFLLLHSTPDLGPGGDDLFLVLQPALEDAAFEKGLQVALDAQIGEDGIGHLAHRPHIGRLIADMLDGIDRRIVG